MAVGTNIEEFSAAPAVKPASRAAFAVMGAGVALGLLGQELFYDSAFGVNVTIFAACGFLLTLLMVRMRVLQLKRWSLWLLLPIMAGAAGLGLNDSRGLQELNIGMMVMALGLISVIESEEREPPLIYTALISFFVPIVYGIASLLVPFQADWNRLRPRPKSKTASGLMLGLLAGFPVVIALGWVLAQADPVFGRIFSFSWQIDQESFSMRLLLFCFLGAYAAGAWATMSAGLRLSLFDSFGTPSATKPATVIIAPDSEHEQAVQKHDPTQAITIFATFFGLIGLLFLTFILVQVRYLFGGNDVVLKTAGLTYAEYARRGFFEITTVTALMLPILLCAQSMLKSVEAGHRRLFNWVAVGMSGLLLCLLASATVRMSLYVQAYGLSPLRFYVCAGIVWLAAVILLYAHLGTRWKLSRFGLASVASAFVIGMALNIIRPDAVIASVNLSRTNAKDLDQSMIINAGADAWPALQSVPQGLRTQWLNAFAETRRDWKSLSLSRWKVLQTGLVPQPPPPKKEEETSDDWD